MANKRYNKQTLFRNLKSKEIFGDKIKVKDLKKISTGSERPKKMGGGMMKKRSMLKAGTKPMKNNGKASKFGMLSVKAGIDKNPKPTQADRIAGAKMKKKNA
jgi:hypothetical protein